MWALEAPPRPGLSPAALRPVLPPSMDTGVLPHGQENAMSHGTPLLCPSLILFPGNFLLGRLTPGGGLGHHPHHSPGPGKGKGPGAWGLSRQWPYHKQNIL